MERLSVREFFIVLLLLCYHNHEITASYVVQGFLDNLVWAHSRHFCRGTWD